MLVFHITQKLNLFVDSAREYNIFECRLLIFDLQFSKTLRLLRLVISTE